ncbi:MAG: PilZ domain-containing protein [Desulfobacterales bacterium]|nr:PilZ domain-containing protein [Desulfobacterales bacterium]
MVKRIKPGSGKAKPAAPILRRTLNNRLHARTLCSVATHFAANRQLFRGVIKNLSAGGTYIQVKGRFAVGGDVIVAGPFAADQEETKRHGKIVRLDANGIAVRFLS